MRRNHSNNVNKKKEKKKKKKEKTSPRNEMNHLKEKCRAAELQIRGERGIEDNSKMIFLIS